MFLANLHRKQICTDATHGILFSPFLSLISLACHSLPGAVFKNGLRTATREISISQPLEMLYQLQLIYIQVFKKLLNHLQALADQI